MGLVCTEGSALASISWNVKITPAGGGSVAWATSSPPASGTLTAPGKLTFDENAYLDLTFDPKPGYNLVAVMKNSEDWTPYLDASRHFRFGPVSSPHTITAVFEAEVQPDPTGSFPLAFPAGNETLTRILSLTGNYQGVSPVVPQRAYDIDVAQDESGKIMSMGTVAGVQDGSGNGDLALNLGQVRTVNGEPVAEVKSSFKGSADGMDASFKSSGSFPLEPSPVSNLARTANAVEAPLEVAGTATYSGKANGIPFSGKNEPLQFEAPPGAGNNVKQDWSLQLEISNKIIQGKPSTVASASLVLPDGTTLQFPEKKVKYSATKGYNLAFKKGTNVTAVPNVVDAKTAVSLTGLVLELQGEDWVPTAGTITYSFLGQKGVEDLTDFLAP